MTYLSSFAIWASSLAVTRMKITDGRVQKSIWNKGFFYYTGLTVICSTWKPQNLGCCIGENLLKHNWLHPGWFVSQRKLPFKCSNYFGIKSFISITNLLIWINITAHWTNNKQPENKVDQPPKIVLLKTFNPHEII